MTPLAHLYSACKFAFPNDPTRPDMEFIMKRQGKSRMYLGSVPQSIKEARKKLLLASGESTINVARGRRVEKWVFNKDKRQWYGDQNILGKLYMKRMCSEPSTQEAKEMSREMIHTMKSNVRAN